MIRRRYSIPSKSGYIDLTPKDGMKRVVTIRNSGYGGTTSMAAK
jgi:hypothetical protein